MIERIALSVSISALAAIMLGTVPSSTAIAADDVKIGILLPLSGPIAPIGQNNRRGHALAVDEINAAGGIKSLGGAKLVMVDGDTQGNPKVGIQETEKLITQRVSAILGAYQSNVTFPTTQIAEKSGVPYIDPVAIADSITEGRNFKFTFKVAPKASWYARDQLKFIKWVWPAAGSEDTELGVLMGPEVDHGTTEVYARVQA